MPRIDIEDLDLQGNGWDGYMSAMDGMCMGVVFEPRATGAMAFTSRRAQVRRRRLGQFPLRPRL
jgi:hypothetical protein